ncbi:MAG TPA: Ig-like domain-containing protein [Burkholderiaceae bacterium]
MQDSAGAFDATPNTLTIHVTPVDDLPVAVADGLTAVEDQPLVGSVAPNDTLSADGGNVFALVSGPANGVLVFGADGSFTYTPNADYTGPDAFTYSLTDADGSTATAVVSIAVTPAADAPVASPDSATAPEDSPIAGNVLANDTDTDADGDALQVTQFVVGGITHAAGGTAALAGIGTLTIQADGAYLFVPVADYHGPVPVAAYTVSDGTSASTSTLTLNVTPVNDPPVLSLDADQSHNTVVVQAIVGLFNTGQSDAGGALALGQADPHYAVVSQPAGGTVSNTAVQLGYGWLPGDADATWIGSTANQAQGLYTYQTGFTLQAGADPRTVLIGFDLASDNSLVDILVNGVSTGVTSNLQYGSLTRVELNGANMAFQAGANTITFVVDNRDSVAFMPNNGPTGLLIDNMAGSVAVIVPSATTAAGDYATIFVEGGASVAIADTDTRVTDIDSPTLQGATITLTNAQPGDLLAAGALPPGIVASVDPTGTVVTLTGSASLAAYEAAIHAVQFANTATDPSSAIDRIVTVVVRDDAGLSSNVATTTIHVVAVDAPPALDLDGNDSTTAGTGYTGTFVENGSGVPIVDVDVAITDADSTTVQSATIHLTNVQPGDLLALGGALPGGISAAVYDPVNGVLTLSGTASLAAYQAALRAVVYSNAGDSPDPTPRVIEIRVNDAGGSSNVATTRITVVPVNDAPAGTDATLTTAEDTAYVLGRADFGFSDPLDVPPNGFVAVTVGPASAGTLTLAGVAVISATLVTTAQLDAGLLQFMPAPNATGIAHASFTFRVTDDGGTANGGVDTDASPNTITFDVTPVDEAPVAVADSVVVVEDTPFIGSVATNDTLSADGGNVFALVTGPASGSLVFNADGTFTYTPNADANGPDTFTYSLTDADGSVSTAVVTLQVGAVNDAPVATDDLASTPINTPLTGIAVLPNDSDVDGDPLTVTGAVMVDPAQGTVSVAPDGTLSFTPAANVTGPVVITYTIADGQGGTDTATLTVNVGTNSPPTGADSVRTIAEDGSYSVAASDFGFADADAGQSFANVRIDALPTAGTLLLNGIALAAGASVPVAAIDAGGLVFVPAPDANGTPYASFSFSVQDSAGAFDTAPNTLTIHVTPMPDAAVIGGGAAGATVEDTTLTATGTLTVTDADAGEATFQPQSGVAGAHGTFGIDATGVWTYVLNNIDPAVQALGAGQTLPAETFAVQSADGTTVQVVVTITGTDDAPVISTGAGAVTENTSPVASGTLTASDVDNPTLAFVPATIGGNFGSLVLQADGSWTYTLDARAEPLAQGQVVSEPITVQLSDGSTTVVTITVTGTNDAAIVTGPATGSVTEDATLSTGGTLTATDVDGPATFAPRTVALTYGDFTIDAAGVWSYTLRNSDANVQALTSSQQPTETVQVATADGTLTNITITVNGANERPVASVAPASGDEDVALPITLGANDNDGTVVSFTVTALPPNGTLLYAGNPVTVGMVIPATADSATLAFVPDAGWSGSTGLNFSATDNEGAVSTIVFLPITIQDVNDAPQAGGDIAVAVEAGGVANATAGIDPSGNVLANDTDPDFGDTLSVSAVSGAGAGSVGGPTAGLYGTLVLAADGSYTYTVDNTLPAVQALRTAGDTLLDTFTYTVIDPWGATSTATLQVTVTGANDAPVAVADVASVTEDLLFTSSAPGVLGNDTDVDAGDTRQVVEVGFGATTGAPGAPIVGLYGTLTLQADGSYTYLADRAAAQALAAGQTATEQFVYTVRDTAGATSSTTLTLTITGTNDAPVITVPPAQTTLEDAPRIFSAANGNAITVADVDGDVLTTTLGVANGTLTLGSTAGVTVSGNGTGSVTLTGTAAAINAALNGTSYASTADYNGTDTLNVTTSDGSLGDAESIAITITPVVDIRGNTYLRDEDQVINVFELADDSFENPGRLITAIDGVSIVTGGSVVVSNGTVTLLASGALSFLPTPNFTGSTSFTYTVTSGGVTETATVVMQIAPINDAPAGTDGTVTLDEDSTHVLGRADFGFTDPNDTPANNFASVLLGPTSAGTLTLNGVAITTTTLVTVAQLDAGLLRFTPAPNANGTAYATLQFLVRDDGGTANGGVDTDASLNTLTFDVRAVNDPATIGGLRTGATVEDGTLTASGTLTVADIDAGQAAFIAQSNVPGAYGSFSIDAAGQWTYVLNNASLAVQALAQGQAAPSEVFTVASIDGTTTTVTVSVTGTNDAPVAVDDIVLTNIVDQNVSIGRRSLVSNDTDVDTGATQLLTFAYNAVNGTVSGNNPVVYRAANQFGPSAQVQAESLAFAGDSETNPLNNSIATAYEIARSRFGLPTAGDAPNVAPLLPSFKWTGRIDDLDGTPTTTDQDWLKVYLRAGETIILDVDGADRGSAAVGTDPLAVDMYVQLYDAAGNMLAENDDADYRLGGLGSVRNEAYATLSLDSYLEYTVATDGFYYVNATAWNNNESGILQDDGNYDLWVSIRPSAAASTGSFDYNMTDSMAADAGRVTVTTVYGTTITGTAANEIVIGGATNDTVQAGGGNDWVQGGAGNDTLTGGAGADVFAWVLADRGTGGTPSIDTITDFNAATPTAGGDVLDLRDLLQGEAKSGTNPGNLQNYLDFDTSSAPGSTIVRISSTGGFTSGFYSPSAEDQRIVLQGINVRAPGTFGLSAGATDYDVIQQLLQRGKLVTDGP